MEKLGLYYLMIYVNKGENMNDILNKEWLELKGLLKGFSKDIHKYIEEDVYNIIINGNIEVILDGETRAELLDDLCK